MSDYISREAVVQFIRSYRHSTDVAFDMEKRLDDIPAADVRPRWIPLSEKLPEENAPCIVYNKDYGPMVGWRVDGERFRIPGSRFPDHPTHWMPLPEPPKEET